jgi:hypothetical protein
MYEEQTTSFLYMDYTEFRSGTRLWSSKVNAIFLSLVIFAGILSLTNSLQTSTTVINSTGAILTNKVMAKSGSPTDIQNAIDSVYSLGGGTVYVPAGNFTFNPTHHDINANYGVMIPGGVSVIGAGINKTILTETVNPGNYATGGNPVMFYVHDGHYRTAWWPSGKPVRISGFTFKGFVDTEDTTNNIGIQVATTRDFRIDHNMFIDFSSNAIGTSNTNLGVDHPNNTMCGVIDHNVITQPYKLISGKGNTWGYGIIVGGQIQHDNESGSWLPITNYLGRYTNDVVYVENNIFHYTRHAISENAGGFYVARYNTFYDGIPFAQIDIHGFNGGRGLEAYNNTIIGPYQQQIGIQVRGGGGVIYNNTILNLNTGVKIFVDPGTPQPYWLIHDLWIWGNTVSAGKTPFVDGTDGNRTLNVDYFLRAPTLGQDGFTYTPYPYPHPLTLQP